MQMRYLPARRRSVPDYGTAVYKARTVVQVKCDDRRVPDALNDEPSRLDIHVRSREFVSANLLEDNFEYVLVLAATLGAFGKGPRVEDGRVIVERQTKGVPIEVIECGHKSRERRLE